MESINQKKKPEFLENHPILKFPHKKIINFYFNDIPFTTYEGEVITSALAAYGIYNISENHIDKTAQGLFCANGMCAQCRVIANGKVVKGCMTKVKEGMKIYSIKGLADINKIDTNYKIPDIIKRKVDVLIIGAGPAGLSAGIELGKNSKLNVLIVDDKDRPGGKLILQTHKFFGSKEDCYAGKRGIEIAEILYNELKQYNNVNLQLNTYFTGAFEGKIAGLYDNNKYYLIETDTIILATGAREKFLNFEGNHLPGIFGAGAFQTLVNRDLVKSSDTIFVIGAGNVGLIAAYHAIQAGIKVAGVCDVVSNISGYKVHLDKLKRFGVKIYLNHTIIKATGNQKVEKIYISPVNENFKPLYKNIKSFKVDTLLIATGLKENNEIEEIIKKSKINLYKCGDANEIAEASSAMFSGKLTALKLLKDKGYNIKIDESFKEKEKILKSPAGKVYPATFYSGKDKIFPSIFCYQEIPCNPCMTSCPVNSIKIKGDPILDLPEYYGGCIGCMQCVLVCPGLAITLVDNRKVENNKSKVLVPFELNTELLKIGEKVTIVDFEGNSLGKGTIEKIQYFKKEKRSIVHLIVSSEIANKVAGFKLKEYEETKFEQQEESYVINNKSKNKDLKNYTCICERVEKEKVEELIKNEIYDVNFIKAATRISMGACGGKTCSTTINFLFKEMKISDNRIVLNKPRPFLVEIPLKAFAGNVINEKKDKDYEKL